MLNIKPYRIKFAYLYFFCTLINFITASAFIYTHFANIKLNIYYLIFGFAALFVFSLVQFLIFISIHGTVDKLKEHQEISHQVLESMPNSIFIHRKFKVIFANTKCANFFDFEKTEDFLGKPLKSFIKINVDALGKERLNNALNEREFQPVMEQKIIKANGEVVEIEAFSKPVFIGGKTAVLSVIKDITEQKRLQELQKKVEEKQNILKEAMEMDRLKNEFFANLSHELRTPLTIIFSIVQLLEKDLKILTEASDSTKNHIKVLKQNCYRLLRLINNLIDMTKIDAGYFAITMQNHDLIPIVENIVLSVVAYAENSGIRIEFDTDVEEKITACNPDKIERILLNLLSNAIKFTKPGGNIAVSVLDEADYLKIVVKDTGIGIPPDKVDTIFDRFVQVDKSFTRNREGSGIGLSIVKALVEMHKGAVRVESTCGVGSTFIITLPIYVLPEDVQPIKRSEEDANYMQRVNIEFSDIYSCG